MGTICPQYFLPVVQGDGMMRLWDKASVTKVYIKASVTKVYIKASVTKVYIKASVTKVYIKASVTTVSYTHLRAHETSLHLVCRLLLEKTRSGGP